MRSHQQSRPSKKRQVMNSFGKKLMVFGLVGLMGPLGQAPTYAQFKAPHYDPPLTVKQLTNIKNSVENEYKNKDDEGNPIDGTFRLEGGYQFTLSHPGTSYISLAGGNANESLKMNTNMRMNLGSVSKMITTITALKMVQDGSLSLTGTIGQYLKDHKSSEFDGITFGKGVEDTTVYELLTQTSRFHYSEDWRSALKADRGLRGITKTNNQVWHQDTTDIKGVAEAGDRFGSAVTTGDFDGDGNQDLAIGVPGERIGSSQARPGMVHVVYGREDGNGLSKRDDYFAQPPEISATSFNSNLTGMAFGDHLASGDFNGDGVSDLAISIPDATFVGSSVQAHGAVYVLYGNQSEGKLSTTDSQLLSQKGRKWKGAPETQDFFGYSLAAGDFDGNGVTDLAVGIPYEDLGDTWQAGAVQVFYGSTRGFTGADHLWTINNAYPSCPDCIIANPQDPTYDHFGWSLAAGDFDGDNYADLAIGIPDRKIQGQQRAGAIRVLYGSGNRLTNSRTQEWSQAHKSVVGSPEEDDQFGRSLAAGDFNGDGLFDLAIGVPFEDLERNTIKDAGAVNVLYGGTNGLIAAVKTWDTQVLITQKSVYKDGREPFDRFGWVLTSGDFNFDGNMDLAVGVPFEDVKSIPDAGLVQIFYGEKEKGMAHFGSRTTSWYQDKKDIAETGASNDMFGSALAVGDFKKTQSGMDLVVGVRYEDLGTDDHPIDNAGAVHVFYGKNPSCNFENTDVIVGEPTLCERRYQNVNFRILRYVIEAAANLPEDHPDNWPENFENHVKTLWLDDIAPDMSCKGNENMLYYPSGEQLIGPSKSCSSGGWYGSALDMRKVLKAIRSGKVLNATMTGLLNNTSLKDGANKKTAIGWEPPEGGIGGGLVLRKDGALPEKLETCVAHFPQEVDMVLLVNDKAGPFPCDVLKRAWKAKDN